jgi:hypothetical protein
MKEKQRIAEEFHRSMEMTTEDYRAALRALWGDDFKLPELKGTPVVEEADTEVVETAEGTIGWGK